MAIVLWILHYIVITFSVAIIGEKLKKINERFRIKIASSLLINKG